MKINANFTNEEILILATAKGRVPSITEMYEEEVITWEGKEATTEAVLKNREAPNKRTPEEYMTNWYQQMIIDDATNVFIRDRMKDLEEQKQVIANDTKAEMEGKFNSK